MDDQSSAGDAGTPGDPGERRPTRMLDRAPSQRFRDSEVADEVAPPSPPVARAVVLAVLTAVVGGIALAVAGEILKITAGLVVIAAVVGWVVAAVLTGALGPDASMGPAARRGTALTIALLGVALGQVGLWLIARNEGGVLSLVDYLAEVFGFLVLVEFALAAVVAWWRAT